MTAPVRWEPDPHMVDALLSSPKASRRITDMRDGDRAWIIAGLELRGEAAERTAERMGCSLRLVRSLRAEDITQMARLWLTDVARHDSELRAEQSGHSLTRRELTEAVAQSARLQRQLDQVLDKLMAGTLEAFPRCGHPKVGWNLYSHTGPDGRGRIVTREYCRQCNNDRAARYRDRRKVADKHGQSHQRVTKLHPDSIGSAP